MHDIFHLHDLANDAQHRMLIHWLDILRHDKDVPFSAFEGVRLPAAAGQHHVVFDLAAGSIRRGMVIRAGTAVATSLGIDPVGMRLEELMPASYVNDLIPAYAICATAFRPLSSLDLVLYSDGTSWPVRRLVLPIGRQPAGAPHTARYLMMVYAPLGEEEAPAGTCRTLVGIRSEGIALFKDGLSSR